MKLQSWGTAAAEGIPGIFCNCKTCQEARKKGGKYIRGRSQVLLEEEILVDFNADTYRNSLQYHCDLSKISEIVITHVHEDHYYPIELMNLLPGRCKEPSFKTLTLHGSEDVEKKAREVFSVYEEKERIFHCGTVAFDVMKPYETRRVGSVDVTPLPATHNTPNPFVYIFSKDGKTMLLLNDSGYLKPEVMAWLKEKKIRFDLVSYDCTYGKRDVVREAPRHMGLPNAEIMRQRFIDNGNYKPTTLSVLTHFTHNASEIGYDEFLPVAAEHGFEVAYDGMTIEF